MSPMSIVDNNDFVTQDGRRNSSTNGQFMGDTSIDFVDSVLAQSLQTHSNVEDVLKVTPFIKEGQIQDTISMPPMTIEDIADFLMELENTEEPTKNNNTIESQVLPMSRDMFEPIPLSDLRNLDHCIVVNREKYGHDSIGKPAVTVLKAENYQLTLPNIVGSQTPLPGTAVVASNSPTFEEDSSSSSASASSDEEQSHQGSYCPKFRGYQCDQWNERFEELSEFFDKNGHSSVPHTELINKRLARWVKRQRYQYKLRQEGRPSAMTDERIKALEQLQFTWDSHGSAFEERLKDLEKFKASHKHCNVPSNYRANRSLASWVKCQRRQYRLYREGKHSNITQARIDQLERMGFQFNLREGYPHHHTHQRNSGGWL